MASLSGLSSKAVLGRPLSSLPAPWSGLLSGFLTTDEHQLRKVKLGLGQETRVLNLHKAAIDDPGSIQRSGNSGSVILVEDLSELHTLEEELTHSERLASIGRLAAGVAHEIGNPVTGIASLAQNLLDDSSDPAFLEEGLELILEQTRRISNIVQSLVNFSHGGSTRDYTPAAVNICHCIDEAVRLVRLSHAGKQLEYRVSCDEQLELSGDRQRIIQVFVNLLSNACDASRPGDAISVAANHDGNYACIEVEDSGHGIPEAYQEKVFEPFFTTKEPGEGTGLGLPLVYSIIQEHSGSITLHSAPGKGTRFIIRLPQQAANSPSH
jgi:signal transduction histidine kinase